MSKFAAVSEYKYLVFIALVLFATLSLCLFISYNQPGSQLSHNVARTGLSAEIDLNSSGLNVFSNNVAAARFNGKVKHNLFDRIYIMEDRRLHKTLLVIGDRWNPTAGSNVSLQGKFGYIYSSTINETGLQLIQLAGEEKNIKEYLYVVN